MKTKRSILNIALIVLLTVSCSSSDDSSGGNAVYGIIQLSGPDTSEIGSTLTVGNINADALGSTGTSSSVVLADENTTFENGVPNPTDFSNGFIIVAAEFDDNAVVDKTISMTILKNGEEYRYVCSTPPTSAADNTDCGVGFSTDKVAKEVKFDDTTVINVDTGTILTMNGTINYD
ncbi:hypothetical protein KO504_05215 [Winogradskyella psychrotolerans]|uniref:hypothetical protein n=1 Tax=Winogradskyella psychrotolerans TaxID=1344585 RepID=UPI001C075D16|nr:hypothetical protein [Winogradskyella psychrotolerans]MBU2920730.1 hypothetical protein [Winogradskyella psychrotolerans]